MGLPRMHAGNKSVQALDLVYKSMLCQEIKGAIGDRRLGSKSRLTQPVQDRICPKRPVFLKQQFQHLSSHWRQTQTFLCTVRLGGGQHLVDAGVVVMLLKSQWGQTFGGCGLRVSCHVNPFQVCRLQCYNITWRILCPENSFPSRSLLR